MLVRPPLWRPTRLGESLREGHYARSSQGHLARSKMQPVHRILKRLDSADGLSTAAPARAWEGQRAPPWITLPLGKISDKDYKNEMNIQTGGLIPSMLTAQTRTNHQASIVANVPASGRG